MTIPDDSVHKGFRFDAIRLFELGDSIEPLPDPDPGEVVIRVGEWSLQDLRDNPMVIRGNLMPAVRWCDVHDWSRKKLIPGVYRLRLPIPGSNGRSLTEQQALFLPGEEVAPVSLVAVATLCRLMQETREPLEGHWFRCAERLASPAGYRVLLGVSEGRVYVRDYWDGLRHENVWLAGWNLTLHSGSPGAS